MADLDDHIKNFQIKLQLLIKKNIALKIENDSLISQQNQFEEKEKDFKLLLDVQDQKLGILKASAGTMTGDEQKQFEKRINQYLKEIDKCINMLSE